MQVFRNHHFARVFLDNTPLAFYDSLLEPKRQPHSLFGYWVSMPIVMKAGGDFLVRGADVARSNILTQMITVMQPSPKPIAIQRMLCVDRVSSRPNITDCTVCSTNHWMSSRSADRTVIFRRSWPKMQRTWTPFVSSAADSFVSTPVDRSEMLRVV